jgi:hypothetical protein
MSLRWRYAPACGSVVAVFLPAYPAFIPRPALRNSGTHWANFIRAYGALSIFGPEEHLRLPHFQILYRAFGALSIGSPIEHLRLLHFQILYRAFGALSIGSPIEHLRLSHFHTRLSWLVASFIPLVNGRAPIH